jgi:predicted HicB family RNase H-like nuclease
VNDTMLQTEGFSARCQKVLGVAKQLFQGKPDWVTFFRETLGVNGAARSVFPTQADYAAFEDSREFTEIQKLVGALRNKKASSKNEVTRVITVRLPESLHESLKHEASDHNTSMNKLCISKLLQGLIDEEKENQAKAQQATGSPIQPRVTENPVAGTIGQIGQSSSLPSRSAQAVEPPQNPNFRSTYNPANQDHTVRFGQ